MSDLQSLIVRVEKATAGSRELDALIAFTLEYKTMERSSGFWQWRGAQPRGLQDRALSGVIMEFATKRAPEYSSSLDAALSLVARVRPGANISIEISETMMDGRVFHPTDVTICGRAFSHEPDTHAHADEPALAICLALLKAVQAQAAPPEGSMKQEQDTDDE